MTSNSKSRQINLLQIAELGVSLIREKSALVELIKQKEIQNLIDDMIATVKEVNGVGIAAPQVYRSLRIFILASHPNPRYPKAPRMKPQAVINPEIIAKSDEIDKNWEGCLSIPGIRGLIPRYEKIKVKYYTRKGKLIEKELTDFIARIFQHEYDHLEGKVFLDHLESTADIISEKEYQKIITSKTSK